MGRNRPDHTGSAGHGEDSGFWSSKVGAMRSFEQRHDMILLRFNKIFLAGPVAISVLELHSLAWLYPMPGHHMSGCTVFLQ